MPKNCTSSYSCFCPPNTVNRFIPVQTPIPSADLAVNFTNFGVGGATFRVNNLGPSTAENVFVRIDLTPNVGASFSPIGITVSQGTATALPNVLTWDVGNLAGGSFSTIGFPMTPGTSPTSLVGSAWTTTSEPTFTNNTNAIVTQGPGTEFLFSGTAGYNEGDPTGTVSFTVFNISGVTAQSVFVQVIDPTFVPIIVTSVTGSQGSVTPFPSTPQDLSISGGNVGWVVGTLNPGQTATINLVIDRSEFTSGNPAQWTGAIWTTTQETTFLNNTAVTLVFPIGDVIG